MRAWAASRALIGTVLLAGALPAGGANVIWKCQGPKGETVFQSEPCPPGKELGSRIYDTPDRAEAIAERRRIQQEMDRRNAQLHRSGGGVHGSPSVPTGRSARWRECQAAKEAADRASLDGAGRAHRDALERRAVQACFGL